jgi:glutaredoxin-related protein
MNYLIYSKENCPYCEQIKQVMNLLNLNHEILSLDENFSKKEFYEIFGESSTFPQVIVDGTQLGGCKDTILFLKEQKVL